MKAPAKLGLYGLTLAAVFVVAGVTANAVVPEETVQNWTQSDDHDHDDEGAAVSPQRGGDLADATSLGLGVAQDGYRLTDVGAPAQLGDGADLSLTVIGPDGQPVTDFELEHEKELHLIVVRADGQHFQHVHPARDDQGVWTIPWQWEAGGTYRVFADFVPAGHGEGITLSTSLDVAGDLEPVQAEPATTTTVDGFEVSVDGELRAGESSELIMSVERAGEPITSLEPYLGAFGHLVALRDGDLAYLHVHPHGEEPQAGQTSGPEIVFEATAPTAGRYLLFLDFKVDGQVRTAPLVIDVDGAAAQSSPAQGGEHEGGSHDH